MKKINCRMLVAGVLLASVLTSFAAKREDVDFSVWRINGVQVTPTAAELNIMDGVTATADQLNAATNLSASGVSAAKLIAGTVASAIGGSAITNIDAANIDAASTASAFDGSAITALDAANITAGSTASAFDGGSVTNVDDQNLSVEANVLTFLASANYAAMRTNIVESSTLYSGTYTNGPSGQTNVIVVLNGSIISVSLNP